MTRPRGGRRRQRKGPRPLNERERQFVEAYMGRAAGNATDAATIAGYSAKTAASTGSRLLRKAKIRAAIDSRVQKDPAVATREARQTFWTKVMQGEKPFKKTSMKDRLKASELLGKSHGDFIERTEHTGKNGAPLALKVTFGGRYRPEATT